MKTMGRNIGFVGNCMAESTVYFFVLILNIIFKAIIEIEIFEKQFLALKKFVSKVDL